MRNLSEQKFNEMIHAFSAGCLDRNEYLEFLEYLSSGKKAPDRELGELQNVVSLLPAILEIERPAAEVKDRVAKRLYRMREELKEKRRQSQNEAAAGETAPANENIFSEKVAEKPEMAPPLKTTGRMTVETPLPQNPEYESPVPEGPAIEGPVPERERNNRGLKKSTIFEVPYTEADKPESEAAGAPASQNTANRAYRTMEPVMPEAARPAMEEPEAETKSYFKTILVMSVVLVLVLIAGAVTYLLMNRRISQGKEQIASLSGQVNALNSEMLRLDRNQKVLAVLSAKDLRTINLDGTAANSGGFGKLTLLENGSEGVIQLYNMPALKDSSIYELWLQSGKNYYSLGTFKTRREVEYFPFSVPGDKQGKIDSYIVTLETGEGKTAPSDKIYLMTTFNGK
ncbi:MAG TPA: anti-sigma factor [Ignavibacteriales bacterium]|nr:anti-sigma factor [Ignavibacteriales bacterium]